MAEKKKVHPEKFLWKEGDVVVTSEKKTSKFECNLCVNHKDRFDTCKAFKKIPAEILTGKVSHRVLRGDEDIMRAFERRVPQNKKASPGGAI